MPSCSQLALTHSDPCPRIAPAASAEALRQRPRRARCDGALLRPTRGPVWVLSIFIHGFKESANRAAPDPSERAHGSHSTAGRSAVAARVPAGNLSAPATDTPPGYTRMTRTRNMYFRSSFTANITLNRPRGAGTEPPEGYMWRMAISWKPSWH